MTASTTDPLAPLLELPGVAEGAESIRRHVEAVHAHRTNRRGWPTTAAEASVRAARASAALDGGSADLPEDGPVTDPVLAGSLRVAEALGGLLPTWRRAPLQALARLHVLAATDRVPESDLGRPRPGAWVSARLDALAGLVVGGTSVPGPVLVGVVHGEMLALAPFLVANGVVARAAARLTAISTGLDPKGLVIPEVGHLRASGEYSAAAQDFASGTHEGLARWFAHGVTAWRTGAKEATGIADAAG
ncbi:oxidoreductase [Actinomycetospora sp. OC33-EN08]|uniref:Oxidoreductase n=1 Tax=Actinomycetospora aurantiaca TaxID=3129233 RepID=A0ABU8MQG0_9PSEU